MYYLLSLLQTIGAAQKKLQSKKQTHHGYL